MRKKIIVDASSVFFYLKVILKVTQENKDCGTCSNGVTIYPEMNVTTCTDTVSLIKHENA